MFDVEATMVRYEKVMALSDPRPFVAAFKKDLKEVYPFWRAH